MRGLALFAGVLAALALAAPASASALSFGPDLNAATADNTVSCGAVEAYSGCTAWDPLTSSVGLQLPDPFFNGDQTGVVTDLHVLSASTAPAQFVVIEVGARRDTPGSEIPTGIMAVSAQVTLHPGINNFNTNLPIDYRWSPSNGVDSWSVVGLNILNGTSPVPGWKEAPPIDGEPGLSGETGLLLDCGSTPDCLAPGSPNYPLPFTMPVADITVAPHYAVESGFVPMRLLLSGDVTITTPGAGGQAPAGGGQAATLPQPTLINVSQTHRRWREGNKLATFASARRTPVGTTFRFTVNEAATIKFAFSQPVAGRKVHGKCVAETRANRNHRACTRSAPRGSLSSSAGAGTHSLYFQGRVSRTRKLKPGTYTVTITAINSAGQLVTKALKSFTIVPG